MQEDVKQYVRACPTCHRTKPTVQPKPDLRPLPAPDRPMQHITLDWLSGFPMSKRGHNAMLNIVDRFSKWVIIVPCTKQMNTSDLCDILYEKVFSWIGLPESILGDRDSRLTASTMRKLSQSLGMRVIKSTAYHPQTDGQTENFHKTLLSMLRAFVDEYHSNWESLIPALLYAYHNTVHSATGYTPHHLMFGWTPRDLRAPLISGVTSDFPHISEWAQSRASDFNAAKLHIEHVQAAMIRAHKASDNAHVYQPGDLVKVSTRALPICMTSTQAVKLLPKYIGPFKVTEVVNPGAYRSLELPAAYVAVHDVINQELIFDIYVRGFKFLVVN